MINRLRSWTRTFFGISTREANGLIILLPILLVSVFIIPAYHQWQSKQPADFSENQRKLDSLLAHWPQQKDSVFASKKINLFTFDPNTASLTEFDSLGFPDFLAQRIHNYRSKNGKFRVKTDLLKLYGMDTAFYNQVAPYIYCPISMLPILKKKLQKLLLQNLNQKSSILIWPIHHSSQKFMALDQS